MTIHFQILEQSTISSILSDAKELLKKIGVAIEDPSLLNFLAEHEISIDRTSSRAFFSETAIENACSSVPSKFSLFNRSGEKVADLGEGRTFFVPGSAALDIFDSSKNVARKAVRADLDQLAKLVQNLAVFHVQSTSIVPSDVPRDIADRVRLYHALRWCDKPLVTGTFKEDSLAPMVRMLEAVRGTSAALKEKPLAIFDCCPTAPLTWPKLTSNALMQCARLGVPAEIIPVPLLGATGPVTLHGALVQIAAENLSGIVIHQLTYPGAPLIWGGCPMSFDMKYGTTRAGAPETMLLNAASSEIAKYLGIPSHGYLTLSDAKTPDMQAGFESGQGALMAVLSGLNIVSGAGMLAFINCFSLEKLVFDASICETSLYIRNGIATYKTDFPSLFLEAQNSGGFLKLRHTKEIFRRELFFPKSVVDRSMLPTTTSCIERCVEEVKRLCALAQETSPLPKEVDHELEQILKPEMNHV